MTSLAGTLHIAEFIRDRVLQPRLKKHSCLVVYDAGRRYRDLCLELAGEKCLVVDATDSSLEGREAAMQALRRVGNREDKLEMLLVYVPARPPVTPEEQQSDPFSVYAACGGVFPDGDADDFLAICLRARPDHAVDVRKVFDSDGTPSFATIDAIGTGSGWPQLRTTLNAESARDILLAVLAPHEDQQKKLNAAEAWVDELKDLCKTALGLEFKTRARRYSPLAEELWRFLLFSELALGQSDLPASLSGVPRAPQAARTLVEDLCDQLRNDTRTQSAYVQRAREVETEFKLPAHFVDVHHVVHRGTFRFQERASLRRAVQALEVDDGEEASNILAVQARSVWSTAEESRTQWSFLAASLSLIKRCEDVERELAGHVASLPSLVDFYTGTLRDVDRLQRELDQAQPDILVNDPDELMVGVGQKARAVYRKLIERVQAVFMRHLEADGWPVPRFLSNTQVFERFLAPRLQESGRRVAFILVDALRYELGVELSKQLADDGPVDLHTACAALPSITLVGMASLLPSAATDFCLSIHGDELVPMIGNTPVRTVPERMETFKRRYRIASPR